MYARRHKKKIIPTINPSKFNSELQKVTSPNSVLCFYTFSLAVLLLLLLLLLLPCCCDAPLQGVVEKISIFGTGRAQEHLRDARNNFTSPPTLSTAIHLPQMGLIIKEQNLSHEKNTPYTR